MSRVVFPNRWVLGLCLGLGCGTPADGERLAFDPIVEDAEGPPTGVRPPPPQPGTTNILVIIADDVSPNQTEAYGVFPGQPATPTISGLAADGIRFQNAYAMSTCSPARGSLLTGRYPERFGIGAYIDTRDDAWGLPLSEVTIPEMLSRYSPYGYSTALIGKWHLVGSDYPEPGFHPVDQGFDWFQGNLENLGGSFITDGQRNTYTHWEKSTNGTLAYTEEYATTVTVNDTLSAIARMPEPWFVVTAFNAPHVPLHMPPDDLHNQTFTQSCEAAPTPCYNAMLEALDTELGRLLQGLDTRGYTDRTTIIFLGDNGAPSHGIQAPFDSFRAKGTMYDGGVRVPFIVKSPYVQTPGTVADGLVSVVDILPTVAEMSGVNLADVKMRPGVPSINFDGQSFVPQLADAAAPGRDVVYAQLFRDNGPPPFIRPKRMVRMDDYKLVETVNGDGFFRYLPGQIDEGVELLGAGPLSIDEQAAYDTLRAELDQIIATRVYEGP